MSTTMLAIYITIGIVIYLAQYKRATQLIRDQPKILSDELSDKVENDIRDGFKSQFGLWFYGIQFVIGLIVVCLWPITAWLAIKYAVMRRI